MTLRIMLVGLVASLGFEPPSVPDVSRWAQAGTAWVRARMLDQSEAEVGCQLDLAVPSDCHQVHQSFEVPPIVLDSEPGADDVAFQVVTEEISADLIADLKTLQREEEPLGPSLAAEPTAPVGEDKGCLVVSSDEPVEVATIDESRPADQVNPAIASPDRHERISSAVRLTREALNAWAELIQQPDEDGQPTR